MTALPDRKTTAKVTTTSSGEEVIIPKRILRKGDLSLDDLRLYSAPTTGIRGDMERPLDKDTKIGEGEGEGEGVGVGVGGGVGIGVVIGFITPPVTAATAIE